jgi:uncharacterized protein YigE (DUF2233 family)
VNKVARCLICVMCLAVVASSAREDIVEVMTRVRSQVIDVGWYNVRLLEINTPSSDFDGVTILWMQVPRDDVDITIDAIRKQGKTNDVYEQSSSGDELVVVSAGFHDVNNQPVGLFVSQGRTLSALAPWVEGGVLYKRGPTFGIVQIRQWNMSPSDLEYAVQAKPLVVEGGQNGIVSDDGLRFDRVGIGFTAAGDLLVGGAFLQKNYRALSLYEFGRIMATPSRSGGPGARTMLGLEGGPGAHIYFPGLKRHFGQLGPDFVTNAIHVRRKKH